MAQTHRMARETRRESGTQTVEGRRVGNGLGADNVFAMVADKGNAENFAIRTLDKNNVPPALCAQRSFCADHAGAAGTGRRVNHAEDRTKHVSRDPRYDRRFRQHPRKQTFTSAHEVDFSAERVPLRDRSFRPVPEKQCLKRHDTECGPAVPMAPEAEQARRWTFFLTRP